MAISQLSWSEEMIQFMSAIVFWHTCGSIEFCSIILFVDMTGTSSCLIDENAHNSQANTITNHTVAHPISIESCVLFICIIFWKYYQKIIQWQVFKESKTIFMQ